MKANELRIGNYITDKTGKIQRITPSLMIAIIEGVIDFAQYIPLTEEWMFRFEFEKVGINYERGWLLLWYNKETGTIDFVLNEPHSNKRHITPLQYVHQLQNLCFDLGEELTIKA